MQYALLKFRELTNAYFYGSSFINRYFCIKINIPCTVFTVPGPGM